MLVLTQFFIPQHRFSAGNQRKGRGDPYPQGESHIARAREGGHRSRRPAGGGEAHAEVTGAGARRHCEGEGLRPLCTFLAPVLCLWSQIRGLSTRLSSERTPAHTQWDADLSASGPGKGTPAERKLAVIMKSFLDTDAQLQVRAPLSVAPLY